MSPFVSMANTNTGAIEVLTYTSSVEHYIWFLHVLWRMQKTKKWAQKKLQQLLPNSAKNNISEQTCILTSGDMETYATQVLGVAL